MKRIVLSIIFLFAVVWGWNTIGEQLLPVKNAENTELNQSSEASQHFDQVISVLTEANHYADVSARTNNSLPANGVRRYRPGGFSFDYLFICLKTGQDTFFNSTFKSFLQLSHSYFARQKAMGYYIYTLRKIII